MKLIVLVFCLIFVAASQAKVGFGPGEQEWGYVDVRPGAHMFYWLYYTTANVTNPADKPLVIWLQGGPGASGTGYGNFEEIGPLDTKLNPRNHTWVKDYNVLFIDNPVGTGFSYVDNSAALTTNNSQIAKDLVQLMAGFYQKFPQFEYTPLYVAAESYGGKMAVEFAQLVNDPPPEFKRETSLKGIILIDSWISPIDSVLTWGPFLLQTGMVDQDGFEKIQKAAEKCKRYVEEEKWAQATSQWGTTEMVIMNAAHNVDFYNILSEIPSGFKKSAPKLDRGLFSFAFKRYAESDANEELLDTLMNTEVKKALNIPDKVDWSMSSGSVFNKLNSDFMKPVTSNIEIVLNNTDTNVYIVNGQLDLIVDTPGTYDWAQRLNFHSKAKWDAAPRRALSSKGIIEGFVKKYNKLSFYWVNRSGHMVPADNPNAMAEILKDITSEG